MKHLIQGLAIASVFALSSAATVDYEDDNDSSNLQRHKRNLIANSKKKNRISLNKRIRYNNKKKSGINNLEDDDTLFLTRLLQRNGSMPQTQRPTPRVTNPPIAIITPNPTTPSPITPRYV